MIVTTFWTSKEYRDYASRMEESASRVGVQVKVYKRKNAGNWRDNTHQKNFCIEQAMKDFPGRDVLWVDADCEFVQHPILFYSLNPRYKIAAFNWRDFLWGCVIFMRNDDGGREVIRRWRAQNEDTPQYSDDCNLWELLGKWKGSGYYPLPQEYAVCHAAWRWGLPEVEPVIRHHGIAKSRSVKYCVRHEVKLIGEVDS